MELCNLAPVADVDAVAVEVSDQVFGHRLAQVGTAMEECHERASAGEPDRGLGSRVAATDHADTITAAAPRLGRAGEIEDADPLELGETVDRQAAIAGTGPAHPRASRDLVSLLDAHDPAVSVAFEPGDHIGGRGPGAELPRLRDGAAGQLSAADAGGKTQVILDSPREAGLAAEDRSLEHQRFEALRGCIDGGAEPRRPAAEDQQVDLLAVGQLKPDPERSR